MKKRLYNLPRPLVALAPLLLLPIFFGNVFPDVSLENERKFKSVDFNEIALALVDIWPEGKCGHFITKKTGYLIISLACQSSYSRDNRATFLDALFKRGFVLKKETYQLERQSGQYLYKMEYPAPSGETVFFKLFFRKASFLWPNNYKGKGLLAIYVHDLFKLKDLLRWQTLGIPLSYGVVAFRQQSKKVSDKILEYKQELWGAISLEPRKLSPLLGKLLSVSDALEPEKLATFLDDFFGEFEKVKGISNRMGSVFTENTFAMRALLGALREREVKLFLDTLTTHKSAAFETAQIMSFVAYKRDVILDHQTWRIKKNWALLLKRLEKQGSAIAVVHAGNWRTFSFLKSRIRSRAAPMQFVFVSQLPYNER